MDEQAILATLEHRLATELGRQHLMRLRAEVERDFAVKASSEIELSKAPAEASESASGPEYP